MVFITSIILLLPHTLFFQLRVYRVLGVWKILKCSMEEKKIMGKDGS
jgi:hypothetical protein